MGLLNYYGRFLPNLSTTLAPLHYLLKKGIVFSWGKQQTKAFEASKQLLTSSKVLAHYDPKRELILTCDASAYGVGTFLAQKDSEDNEHPIAFASRSLAPAEKNYSQLDKEAIIFAVKCFHQYIFGRTFVIITDHRPLLGLFGPDRPIPQLASARIQRWSLALTAYKYSLVHRPGCQISNADGLSRLPLPDTPTNVPVPGDILLLTSHLAENSTVTADSIRRETIRDPILSKVMRSVQNGWQDQEHSIDMREYTKHKDELSVEMGCILWGSRVIVPSKFRRRILQELHEGHPGMVKMKSLARSFVWWPQLDNDIEHVVNECSACQTCKKNPHEAPLHPLDWPSKPWDRIHIDYAGPILGKMILVIVDAHSKWIETHVIASATSSATIERLMMTFACHGLPRSIVSDNGSCFTSEEFKLFEWTNEIRHIYSSPYHPASNGLAERAVQTVKNGLKKITEGNLEIRLSKFLARYCIIPQGTTGVSPAELLLKRKVRTKLDLLLPSTSATVNKSLENQKFHHDHKAREREFGVGNTVYVQNFGKGPELLAGIITERRGPVSYNITLPDGRCLRRHVDHIRSRQCEPVDNVPLLPVEKPPVDVFKPLVSPKVPPDESNMAPAEVPAEEGSISGPHGHSTRQIKPPQRLDL